MFFKSKGIGVLKCIDDGCTLIATEFLNSGLKLLEFAQVKQIQSLRQDSVPRWENECSNNYD